MLNIDFLKSGLSLKSNKYNLNISNFKEKKIEYYRLSSGFKDANNTFLKIKI